MFWMAGAAGVALDALATLQKTLSSPAATAAGGAAAPFALNADADPARAAANGNGVNAIAPSTLNALISLQGQSGQTEIFKVVLLDAKHAILRDATVSEGSLTLSIVHPREVFNLAVRESAAAVIFLHNHPSGDPTPSQEDRVLTTRLVAAGDVLGIRVLDHLIVGDGRYVSFADQGWLTHHAMGTEGHKELS